MTSTPMPSADRLLDSNVPPPSLAEQLDMVRSIAEALAPANSRNVYHRALSPWTIELRGAIPYCVTGKAALRGRTVPPIPA